MAFQEIEEGDVDYQDDDFDYKLKVINLVNKVICKVSLGTD